MYDGIFIPTFCGWYNILVNIQSNNYWKDVSEWNINRAILVMERALPFTKHKNELFVGLFLKCDDHGFWMKKWNDNGFFVRCFRLFRHIEIMGYIGNINLNESLIVTHIHAKLNYSPPVIKRGNGKTVTKKWGVDGKFI